MLKLALILALATQSLPAQRQNQPRQRPEAGSLTTWFDQIVPLVIIGDGWSQRIILSNVDTSHSAIGTIQFFTQTGAAWTVSTSTGRNSVFAFSLQPGQTYILETSVSQAPQSLGWAAIQESTNGLGDFLGQTIYRKQTAGLPDLMCSLVLGFQSYSKMTVFFDNTNGNYTGMGVLTSELCVFSCDVPVQLKVTVRDLSGNTISTKTISQKQGVLYWMNLGGDFPETNGKMGMFVVEPVTKFSTTVTGFSLQFAGNGAFTAITPFEN